MAYARRTRRSRMPLCQPRRRAPYKKKPRTTKKRTTGRKLTATERRSLATYHNPWLGKGLHPKIHDGSQNQSTGISSRTVGTLSTENDNLEGPQYLEVLLYPGINGGIVTNCRSSSSFTQSQPMGVVLGSEYHGSLSDIDINADAQNDNERVCLNAFEGKIHKWRTVSEAIHLSLLNPSQRDEGWWEAIRITPNEANYVLTPMNNKTNNQVDLSFHPSLQPFQAVSSLADNPTYNGGRLKDLHLHTFNLQHNDKNHLWQELPGRLRCPALGWQNQFNSYVTDGAILDSTNTLITTDYTAQNACTYQGMDCIYIRIHPRVATIGGSDIKFDHVVNQEVIYSHQSELSVHMSEDSGSHMQDFFKQMKANYPEMKDAAKALWNVYAGAAPSGPASPQGAGPPIMPQANP